MEPHPFVRTIRDRNEPGPSSAPQLRREAAKARRLADAAFGEEERRQLRDVALMLEREAAEIEAAAKADRRP